MKLYIWQFKPSMHQIPLLNALKKITTTVIVFQSSELYEDRKEMGWNVDGLTYDFVLQTFSLMKSLIDSSDDNDVHFFAGTRASRELREAYLYCLKNKKNVYVQSEASNYFGILGKLKLLRGCLEAFHERKLVKGIFAIGSLGVKYYKLIGYNKNKIYSFGYFVSSYNNQVIFNKQNSLFRLIYVGSLTKNKGVISLIHALSRLTSDFELNIIGDGPEHKKINSLISKYRLDNKVKFHGVLSNKEAVEYISQSDLLVLPSIDKDGWGVVINESLMNGTPVLCTNKCGGSVLINNERGKVVRAGNLTELSNALSQYIVCGPIDKKTRIKIRQWAESNITCEVAAMYLLSTIMGVLNNELWSDNDFKKI